MEILWRGTIPSPPNLNEVLALKGKTNLRKRWFPYNDAKKDYQKMVDVAVNKIRPKKPIDVPVYITASVSFPLTVLNSDVDNRAYAKWTLDALTHSKILIEDNQFVIPMPPLFLPGNYSANCQTHEFSDKVYPGLKGMTLGRLEVTMYKLGINFSWGDLIGDKKQKTISIQEQRTIMKKLDLIRNGFEIEIVKLLVNAEIDFDDFNALYKKLKNN